RDGSVGTGVPLRRCPEAGDASADAQGDDPAERVAGLTRRGDRGDHRVRARAVRATHLARLDRLGIKVWLALDTADRLGLAPHLHANKPQDGLRDRTRGDARRRLARPRPLDDIAHVLVPELERARDA